ncbi:glycosyltransferase sugar-binding region containing DXD motif domain-containing protein [Phthorimaea operculella]|nr:glycosyltransferase sugar-binding region containing DXD motif domain-containing protein [Phthorimaea operculella]
MRMNLKLSSKLWCSKRHYIILIFIIFIFLNYFNSSVNFTNRVLVTVKHNQTENLKDLTCQKLPEAVLQMIDDAYSPSNSTIYFLETSCKGDLNSRQACAVESAARQNPDRDVTVLFTGPLNSKFVNGNIFAKFISESMPNIEFRRINVKDFVKGTPLEELFTGNKIIKSKHPVVHSSDILRIITLFKYGGLYLDLDFVVMKSFNSLPNNFVARESISAVGNAILAFSKDEIGKSFLELAVRQVYVYHHY